MSRIALLIAAVAASILLTAAPVAADTTDPENPPVPIAVELVLDLGGSVDAKSGTVTIHGTITCDQDAFASVYGEVRQAVGRLNTIRGWFGVAFDCSTTPTRFDALVLPDEGKFAGGRATVSAWADAYTETGYGFGTDSETIRLGR